MQLRLSKDLSLPVEAVTGTHAILAIRGVGKTHTASVLAEEILKAGQPICVYDPTGAWWGLKSSADGKRPGFPVVVFGGEHADVPLVEHSGGIIATTIIERRIPAILDVSLMRKGERIRFMTDFCETLYHRNREPLHFIADEAHTIAPQNIRSMPEAARLLGAVEDIILQGRRRGLGMTAISQRPAMLNTTVRTQCATLIAMRIIGSHDRKAIREWVEAHGDTAGEKEMLDSLPSLPKGDAWVWSPADDIFKRVHFRQRETFDSSATPKVGQKIITPAKLAEIDLNALGESIKATVEKAKADDPKELRRRIAELEKAARQQAPTVVPKVERVEVPVLGGPELNRVEKVARDLEAVSSKVLGELDQLRQTLAKWATAPAAPAVARKPSPPTRPAPVATRQTVRRNPSSNGDVSLGKGESRILAAIAQTAGGVSREQLTVLTGYKRSSRDTYLQRLRQSGLIEDAGGTITPTDAGVEALGPDFEPLPTGDALREYWLGQLPEGERRVLQVLIEHYPEPVDRDDVSDATGYKRSSRDTYIQRLRSRKLVEDAGRGSVTASDILFDE